LLNILIVEDEPLLADTLRRLIELNPRFRVTATTVDTESALAAADLQPPDLALVDLQLANGTSGFSVAAKLHERGIACLFTTGRAPSFPLPDLAIGCLQKPFREEHLVRALTEAEDILKGRPKIVLRRRLPDELQLYSEAALEPDADADWVPGLLGRTSLAARLWKLVRRPSSFRSATAG
jgi:CheY-like chemotaxis protein